MKKKPFCFWKNSNNKDYSFCLVRFNLDIASTYKRERIAPNIVYHIFCCSICGWHLFLLFSLSFSLCVRVLVFIVRVSVSRTIAYKSHPIEAYVYTFCLFLNKYARAHIHAQWLCWLDWAFERCASLSATHWHSYGLFFSLHTNHRPFFLLLPFHHSFISIEWWCSLLWICNNQ